MMKGDTFILSHENGMNTEKVNDMAKEDKYAQWLMLNKVVQSAADTLTYSETLIPTNPSERKVLAIYGWRYLVGDLTASPAAWVQVTVATKPNLTALELTPDSPYVVCVIEIMGELLTSGLGTYEGQNMKFWNHAWLIAHQKLYLYATSANTAAAQTMRAALLFKFVTVSSEEFFQALTAFGG